jgi:hypothetical protein
MQLGTVFTWRVCLFMEGQILGRFQKASLSLLQGSGQRTYLLTGIVEDTG